MKKYYTPPTYSLLTLIFISVITLITLGCKKEIICDDNAISDKEIASDNNTSQNPNQDPSARNKTSNSVDSTVFVLNKDRTVDNAIKAVEFQLNADMGDMEILNGKAYLQNSKSEQMVFKCGVSCLPNVTNTVTIQEQQLLYDEIKTFALNKLAEQGWNNGTMVIIDLEKTSDSLVNNKLEVMTVLIVGKKEVGPLSLYSWCNFTTQASWSYFATKLQNYFNICLAGHQRVDVKIYDYVFMPQQWGSGARTLLIECYPFTRLANSMTIQDQIYLKNLAQSKNNLTYLK